MAGKERYSAADVIAALEETKGMLTLTARRLGCAYDTVRRYIDTYQTVKDAYLLEREKMRDAVELRLYNKAVTEGDTTALIFMAKTQLKDRGYVERHELRHESWQDDYIAAIKAGRIDFEALKAVLNDQPGLAEQLFITAGVPITSGHS